MFTGYGCREESKEMSPWSNWWSISRIRENHLHLGFPILVRLDNQNEIQLDGRVEEMKENPWIPWFPEEMAGEEDPGRRGERRPKDLRESIFGFRRKWGRRNLSGGIRLHAKPVRPLGTAVRPMPAVRPPGWPVRPVTTETDRQIQCRVWNLIWFVVICSKLSHNQTNKYIWSISNLESFWETTFQITFMN